jgi:hypothetical protein
MKIISLLCLLIASSVFAKDKPAAKPALTAEQKNVLLVAERDLLAAQNAALPYEIAKQHALEALQAKQAEATKDIDAQKWRLDLMTFDFTEVPPPPAPPKPAEDKPAEKK